MNIPDYQSLMLPVLNMSSNGENWKTAKLVSKLADNFKLTEDEQNKLLPSGGQKIFYNRVGWAKTYLTKARLLETVSHGVFVITDRGKKVLEENPKSIDVNYLNKFPEFLAFRDVSTEKSENEISLEILSTPEEKLESEYSKLKEVLLSEMLFTIKECSPNFFEQLVVDLIVKMGYGGSRLEAGKVVGKARDGGIDGVINEDKLGLDVIYIQAKRWDSTVGRPEIQKFVGALQGRRAKKGIFITTSDYSKDALEYVKGIDNRIILISGVQLVEFMFEYSLGVDDVANYKVKKIDLSYFNDE